ncbi:MAG: ATPase, T2SS/T4P/T4SS family [bacterium]|nr:ATPase, T2SS/T4P/T4SS family [bacterium]
MDLPSEAQVKKDNQQAPPMQSGIGSFGATATSTDVTLIDTLLSDHLLTQAQYDEIKMKRTITNQSLEELIKDSGYVPEAKLVEAKARTLGIPFVSLAMTSFSPQAISLLPRAVVDRFSLIPFFYDDKTKTISIAMANPVDLDSIAFVRQKTGLNVRSFAAAPQEVRAAINQQYREELVGEVGQAVKESQQLVSKKEGEEKQPKLAQLIEEAPIAKIVSTILDFAVNSRASDVHIEPLEDRLRVRYRIDGILYDKLSLPKTVQDALVTRIKILSDMKIDEHRAPQDGRFNFKSADKDVDLRISTIPTANGEKIVIRLLWKSGGIPTLQELGLNGMALKNLETAILRPHGIIIVCGPTGSGKTTTLYSVLARLNTTRVNILSLEDPIEYQISGVNQVQINPAVGLTFASGLRSFLRQDPNIILVGEIRDQETTDLALQAALTGHLVFSTLHTSDAAGALPRLIDLGAERFLLASTITAIVGQRIVRKICSTCKESYIPPPRIIEEIKAGLGALFPPADQQVKLYKGRGCSECGNSGYRGRVGIFEVLLLSEKVAQLILEHPEASAIQKEAITEGMITMKQDGYLKVLKGITTVEEVIRVAQE